MTRPDWQVSCAVESHRDELGEELSAVPLQRVQEVTPTPPGSWIVGPRCSTTDTLEPE